MTKQNDTLSSKRIKCIKANFLNKNAKYYFPEENVKQFIKEIKEEIDKGEGDIDDILEFIDKKAGNL